MPNPLRTIACEALSDTNLTTDDMPSEPEPIVRWLCERLATFSSGFQSDMEAAPRRPQEQKQFVLATLSTWDLDSCRRLLFEHPSAQRLFLNNLPGIDSVLLLRDDVEAEVRRRRESPQLPGWPVRPEIQIVDE